MVARRAGFVTRAQAGLRDPRSVSRNITPARGGVGVHYGGPAQRLTSHAQCIARWKFWQDFHMKPGWAGTKNGGADIAYNFGFCDHGFVFAGRGLGVRSAGNGTNAGNQNYYAAVWIGGEGEKPTQAALDALDWIILECRNNGAGREVRPHSWFKATACCGNPLRGYLPNVHNNAIAGGTAPPVAATPPPAPTSASTEDEVKFTLNDEGNDVKAIQHGVRGWLKTRRTTVTATHSGNIRIPNADGKYGGYTRDAVAEFQRASHLDRRDGVTLGECDTMTATFLLRYEHLDT